VISTLRQRFLAWIAAHPVVVWLTLVATSIVVCVAVIPFETTGEAFKYGVLGGLLLVELYVLWMMKREAHEREATMSILRKEAEEREETTQALRAFRYALGRTNYLREIHQAIRLAHSDVVFTTASMERSSKSEGQRMILEAVKVREGQVPYRHRGIVARRPAALSGAIELLRRSSVELRVSNVLNESQLRFVVADVESSTEGKLSDRVILGIAEQLSDKIVGEAPTSVSAIFESRMLGLALRERFDALWEASDGTVFDYLDEHIREARRSEPRYSLNSVRTLLGAGRTEFEDWWLASQSIECRKLLVESLDLRAGAAFDRESLARQIGVTTEYRNHDAVVLLLNQLLGADDVSASQDDAEISAR